MSPLCTSADPVEGFPEAADFSLPGVFAGEEGPCSLEASFPFDSDSFDWEETDCSSTTLASGGGPEGGGGHKAGAGSAGGGG